MLTVRQTEKQTNLLVDIESYAQTDTGVTGHHFIMPLSYGGGHNNALDVKKNGLRMHASVARNL